MLPLPSFGIIGLVWPDAARAIAVEGIHWQIINSARVALEQHAHSRPASEVL